MALSSTFCAGKWVCFVIIIYFVGSNLPLIFVDFDFEGASGVGASCGGLGLWWGHGSPYFSPYFGDFGALNFFLVCRCFVLCCCWWVGVGFVGVGVGVGVGGCGCVCVCVCRGWGSWWSSGRRRRRRGRSCFFYTLRFFSAT